ncbi:MAG: DNA polymerase I [Solibacillus sp.]
MTKEKILLLDGNSLAYRAFFALPLLTNDQGIHTNAVYGFTTMLQKIITEENPTKMLVAFDAGKTTFRHESFSEYKGGRQKTPPELSEQFPYIRKLIDAYQIKRYEQELYEADDIIGTLAQQAESGDAEVVIISGDKDLTQLATEKVTVYITRKGMTDIEKYTPAHIEEKYGLTPLQIIDMKGLMGDTSDNIPGVPGVGEKTAIKLLKEHGSVEALYEAIDGLKASKMKEKFIENEELAHLSKKLATILVEAPIDITLDELSYTGPNEEELLAVWQELGFKSLIEKSDFAEEVKEQAEIEVKMTEITTDLLKDRMALHVELENEHYHDCDGLGLALTDGERTIYTPIEALASNEALKMWLADETKQKSVLDSKATQAFLARAGIRLRGVTFDLLLASYIANPAISGDEVATLAKEFGYTDVQTNETVYGKGAKWTRPDEDALADHVARKALAIWHVQPIVEDKLKQNEQFDLYHDLELPLAHILGKMESEGITVQTDTLEAMGEALVYKLDRLEQEIYALAGETFNINSPKQLGVILFDKLGLPVIKKTKTGYSTAADVLEKLKSEHDVVKHILDYRQLAKLNSTYIEGLVKVVHDDNSKIHTRFQQALTATGRLSSTDPNLQNIPIRLEEGRKIRQAFVPSRPGWVLFAADYSQIELRVLAHMCEDPALVEAFMTGMDIHTRTAMDVFGVEKPEDVTSLMRRTAKAVNFGIIYGISDYGLSQNLDITRKQAATFIQNYLASFPGVKGYMDSIVENAKKDGYVTTILNRRRYLPEINSSNFNLRSFAERTAMNTPIQGSAADIIKKAMIDMDARLEKEGLQAKLLLQVHDELIFEAPAEEIQILARIVPDVMENAISLNVPLKVDFSHGATWYDAK